MDPALWELLEQGDPNEEVATVIRLHSPESKPLGVRIVTQFGKIATCRLRRGDIVGVRAQENVDSMKSPRLFTPEHDLDLPGFADFGEAVRETDERRPAGERPTGRGVVVGVIDWGIDFAHPDFLHDDGTTRLLALWDQRARPVVQQSNSYGYGEIYQAADLNQALRARDPYAAIGYHPADADPDRSGSHGTHVMGIAAGNGRAGGPSGVAPEADLVFVHLSMWGQEEQSRLGDSVTIIEALDFMATTAGNRPWVLNMSLGRHAGPHDGTTLVEQALDAAVVEAPGRAIVQSCGNYFDRLAHASGQLRPGEARTLIWKTDAADKTPNEMDIWYTGSDQISVEIRSPNGTRSRRVQRGEKDSVEIDGREVCKIYNRAHDPNNLHNQINIFLYVGAPAGDWEVTLAGDDIVDGRFHAWIERDAGCRNCQSHFDPEDAVTSTTTGTICNGYRTIAVGAYNAHAPQFEIASFSSCGPTRDGRIKPDLVAPGVGILAARSSPKYRHAEDSMLTRKSGTSMAAPHVAGTVALMHEVATRPLTIHETRKLLLTATRSVPASAELVVRIGSGLLDTERALALTRRFFEAQRQPRPAIAGKESEELIESWPSRSSHLHAIAAKALGDASQIIPRTGRCQLIRPGDLLSAVSDLSGYETESANDASHSEGVNPMSNNQEHKCSCSAANENQAEPAEQSEVANVDDPEFVRELADKLNTTLLSFESDDSYQSYETPAPSFVELADASIATGTRGLTSQSTMLSEIFDSAGHSVSVNPLGAGRAISTAAIFDAFAPGGAPAMRRHFSNMFEVVSVPGQSFSGPLQPGDLLFRRALGEGNLANLAIVVTGEVFDADELAVAGLIPEAQRSGLYVQVIETGAFPKRVNDQFARKLADANGRVGHDQMVLRLSPEFRTGAATRRPFLSECAGCFEQILEEEPHVCAPGEGPPAALPDPTGKGPHPLIRRGTTKKFSRNPSVGDAQQLLNRFLKQIETSLASCDNQSPSALAFLKKGREDLKKMGQDPLGVDCRFGAATDLATRMFQECKGLRRDGDIGPLTWAQLVKLRPTTPPPPPPPPPQITPCVPPTAVDDPTALNRSLVSEATYPDKPKTFVSSSGRTLNIRGNVFYPATEAGPKKPFNDSLAKKAPVVFIAHGNHAIRHDPANRQKEECTAGGSVIQNHRGYEYFQTQLARMGIISVSVDCNETNCVGFGANITERAELITNSIKHFQSLSSSDSLFRILDGHIDFGNVGLLGHSRGGEAVLYVPELPAPHNLKGVTLKGVISLAPTNNGATSGKPDGFAFMTILPADDRDVVSNAGATFYDQAIPSPCKTQLFVHNTNHNFFNTEWVNDDRECLEDPPLTPDRGCLPTGTPLPVRANLMSKDEHKRILSVYGCAFFRRFLLGEVSLEKFLIGREVPPATHSQDVQISAEVKDAVTVDNHEDADAKHNTQNQPITQFGFKTATEFPFHQGSGTFNSNESFFGNTTGLVLERSFLLNLFHSKLSGTVDLTGREVWIRAAEVYDGSSVPAGATGFKIGLEDSAGQMVFVDSDDIGGLPRPHDRKSADTAKFGAGADFTKTMLKTLRFPADCFTQVGTAADIKAVKAIMIHLSRSDNRALAFDQLQIV